MKRSEALEIINKELKKVYKNRMIHASELILSALEKENVIRATYFTPDKSQPGSGLYEIHYGWENET